MVRAMNLRRLRHFDTLYRLGSYARAADELGLTQSAAAGRLVTDIITGATPAIDLAPFSPQRF